MIDARIDMTVQIRRSPSDVFAAWSTADALASWFAPMASQAPEVTMEFRVGGSYTIAMPLPDGTVHTTSGIYREIVPNEKIVMTWRCDAFEDPESTVEVQFRATEEGTEVQLLHREFESSETCDAHYGGWQACLGQLVQWMNDVGESKT